MAERGYECRHFETDSFTEELGETIKEFRSSHVVFPILQLKGMLPIELAAKRDAFVHRRGLERMD